MYCVSFSWEPGSHGVEFHQLNAAIDRVARSLPGFSAHHSQRTHAAGSLTIHFGRSLLTEGNMWPASFALIELTPAEEATIAALD